MITSCSKQRFRRTTGYMDYLSILCILLKLLKISFGHQPYLASKKLSVGPPYPKNKSWIRAWPLYLLLCKQMLFFFRFLGVVICA